YTCLYLRIRGDLFVQLRSFERALSDYDSTISLASRPDTAFKDYEGHALRGLGDYYRVQGNLGESRELYAKARIIAKNTGYLWLNAEVGIGLALLALRASDLPDAQRQVEQVLSLVGGSGWLLQELQANMILASIYTQIGHLEEARQHIEVAKEQ